MANWIFLLLIGIVLWVLNLTGIGFEWERDWPVILILWGIWGIIKYAKISPSGKKKVKKVLDDLEKGKITPEKATKKLEEK